MLSWDYNNLETVQLSLLRSEAAIARDRHARLAWVVIAASAAARPGGRPQLRILASGRALRSATASPDVFVLPRGSRYSRDVSGAGAPTSPGTFLQLDRASLLRNVSGAKAAA